jgi:NAD(P)-dependent dehydrogenase (short-subunit alcohol dehydrogenase family)
MSFTRYSSLQDKVVLISGGASGIGEMLRAHLRRRWRSVAFLDLQEEAAAALAAELSGSRHRPHFLHCALKAALAEARQKLGPASVLANNAANDQRQCFADVAPDELDRTMSVNFRHVYFACQAVIPQMIEQGGGSIVNMSSMA